MKISKLTDYGILVLNHLASIGSVRQSTEEIACATSLAVPTVRKVLKVLMDSGLVQAQRGKGGGYRLSRAPSDIPLLTVVEAFEGRMRLTECSTEGSDCEITETCSLSDHWGSINDILLLVLGGISLEELRNPALLNRIRHSLESASERIRLVAVD
ncbi:MAG: SUF system Fe-S cluster assembly regulator [Oceanobacter sp.]